MSEQAHWTAIKSLFAESLKRDQNDRALWLEKECPNDPALRREVLELLQEHSTPIAIFDQNAQELLEGFESPSTPEPAAPSDFAPFRILTELGSGGMGRVYLAEQVDGQFVHRVALKVIRSEFASENMNQRFLRERAALSRLTHPNIARLYGGGINADNAPYFTMELVSGEPLTAWCDHCRSSIGDRVSLMMKICDAVQHAHRNLIVHRDIKPSNILVTDEGEPKLLDFGIAKPLDDEASSVTTHSVPMTREFASPEQVLGEPITTATDIYSLGVLLYLLLCGKSPYKLAERGEMSLPKSILEEVCESMARAVDRAPPPPEPESEVSIVHRDAAAIAELRSTTPTTLKHRLRGDLDRIVQRALAKEPDARYSTASAMAEDLRASLDGRPLSGDTRTFRFRKYFHRHRLRILAAALLLTTLVVSAVFRIIDASRIEREAQTTAAVKDFLFGMFNRVNPVLAKGKDITAREILAQGKIDIDAHPPPDPIVKAELLSVLGTIDNRLGLYSESVELQHRAAETFERVPGNELRALESQLLEADTRNEMQDAAGAFSIQQTVSQAFNRMRNVPAADRVQLYRLSANTAYIRRDLEQADQFADQSVELGTKAAVDDDVLALTLLTSGNIKQAKGDLTEAERRYRKALDLSEKVQGAEGPRVATLHNNLGIVTSRRSRFVEALREANAALDIDTKILGRDHPHTLNDEVSAALYQFHLGRYAIARDQMLDAVARLRKVLGGDNTVVAGALINMGLILSEIPDLPNAEKALKESSQLFEGKFGKEYPGTLSANSDLGYVFMLEGNFTAAETILRQVRDIDEQKKVDDIATYYWSGELARRRGDRTEARRLDSIALQVAQKNYGEISRYTAFAHYYLGLALRDDGERSSAIAELRSSLQSFAGYIPDAGHPVAAAARVALGSLLLSDPALRSEGVRLLDDAAAIEEKMLGPNDPRTTSALSAIQESKKVPRH